jgi:hypothetical protein
MRQREAPGSDTVRVHLTRLVAAPASAGPRLPKDVDRAALATFALTTMEGGVMLARTYRDVAPFDAAVAELRACFDRLLADGVSVGKRSKRPPVRKSAPPRKGRKT